MFGRHECKFIINEHQSEIICFKIGSIIEKDENSDPNGFYIVKSLYFDDSDNSFAQDVNNGSFHKIKYRIRYYNNDNKNLFLEKKEKINDLCYKKIYKLTREQYDKIISGDVYEFLYNDDLLAELSLLIIKKTLKPKIIVEYRRKAYFEKNTNTRITIDDHICTSREINCFYKGDYLRIPVISSLHKVLEIKYDIFLPDYIKNLSYVYNLNRVSFSKYFLSYEKNNGGLVYEYY